METKAKLLIALTTTIALSGCATDGSDLSFSEKMRRLYKSNIEFYMPPRQAAINQFNDIVVYSETNESPATLNIVESRLAKASIAGQPYFHDVSQKIAGNHDETTGILKIETAPVNVSTRSYRERRDQCYVDDTVRTCSGEDAFFTYVSCSGIYATVSAEYELVNSNQEVIIPATTVKRRVESEKCSDESGSVLSKKAITEKVQRSLGYKIARQLTPRTIERPNDLVTSLDVHDGEVARSVKELRKQASKGDLFTPLESYIELSKEVPESASLLFNIGYLYQATGNFEQAQAYFKKAQDYGFEDTDLLEKHMAEVASWLHKGVTQLSSM